MQEYIYNPMQERDVFVTYIYVYIYIYKIIKHTFWIRYIKINFWSVFYWNHNGMFRRVFYTANVNKFNMLET